MFAPRRAIHTISSAPAPSPPSPSGRTSVPAHQAIRTDENGAFIVRRNENGEISGRTTVVFRDYRAAARVGGGERVGAGERAGERERWAIVGDPLGKLVIREFLLYRVLFCSVLVCIPLGVMKAFFCSDSHSHSRPLPLARLLVTQRYARRTQTIPKTCTYT